MVLLKEKTILFQGSRGGPAFSRGGGPPFSRGGGGYSYVTFYITCDFPGGSGPLSPLWIRTCINQPTYRIVKQRRLR